MQTLKKIFKEQSDFQHLFYTPKGLTFEQKISLSKEYILSAHRELGEALNELPWKSHRKYKKKHIQMPHFREELIDVIKFVLNLYVIWEISPENFAEDFFKKSKKVRKRHNKEKSITS